MKTIEEIESQIQKIQDKMDQSVPILFKKPEKLYRRTLFKFLLSFFFADYETRVSVYLPNKRGQKRLQCYGGARRSATDLYRLFNHTYKDLEKITLIDVITHLHYMTYKGYIYSSYCWDVHKRVYFQLSKTPSFSSKDRIYNFGDKTDEWSCKSYVDNLGLLREDYDLLLQHHPVDEKKELITVAQLTEAI